MSESMLEPIHFDHLFENRPITGTVRPGWLAKLELLSAILRTGSAS